MKKLEQSNMQPEGINIDDYDGTVAVGEAEEISRRHEEPERPSSEKLQKKVQKFLDAHEKALIGGFGKKGFTKKALAPLKKFIQPFKNNEDLVTTYLGDSGAAPLMLEALRQAYVFELDTKKAREDNKWTYGLILEDVRFALPELEKQLRQNDPGDVKRNDYENKELTDRLRFRANAMFVASESLDHVEESDRLAVNQWFKKNFDLLKSAARPYKPAKDTTDCITEYTLTNIISRSNDKELVAACLELAADEERGSFGDPSDLKELLYDAQHQVYAENRKMVATFLAERAGLDRETAEKMAEKWQKAKKSLGKDEDGLDQYRESHLENIDAVTQLESKQPGAAKEIFEKFGIANFARYPLYALLEQLKKADQDLPYGVVALPEADHNGAFLQKRYLLEKLRGDLMSGGQETRFIEAASQYELARRLSRMHQQYSGAGNKMDYLVIGGHGQPESIQLGEKKQTPPPIQTPELSPQEYQEILEAWNNRHGQEQRMRKDVLIDDLKDGGGKGIRRAAGKWFDENAQIVFVSCSTGAEGGFAQTVTNELGFSTIAPNIPAYVKEIKVTFNDQGKPIFDVDFGAADGEQPEAKRYMPDGKVIK
ncbi:hypothetical protein HGA34_05200 [Candidatus Falkowbacteria bacterium]|nr:hypothetical protein [Candidatus Falkowbacteria bacterium]